MVVVRKPNIEVKNLAVIYNQGRPNEARVLENVSLKIYPKEYVIIFGPSGCGKSTLLYTIAGFQQPTSGTVIVNDQDINTLAEKQKVEFNRKTIGMVFQAFYLIPTLSIIDNVCLPKVFVGEDERKRKEAGMRLLKRVGIGKQANKFSSELSGGQKQRVAIARALINSPDIIIADEPTGNLDSKAAYNVMNILRELNERDKKTIILVTHDPEYLSFGDRIIYVRDGKIVKTEEVVEKKTAVLKGEDEEVVKKEYIAPEVKMLMRSFRNFSPSQLGMLLVPFKAQQLLSHVFFNVSAEQLEIARKKLQDVVSGRLSLENFERQLDLDIEKGGAGWDRRNVRRLVKNVGRILRQAAKIDFSKVDKTAEEISEYIAKTFELEFTEAEQIKLIQLIKLRLENKLSVVEFLKSMDRPVKDRGMGLDRRTADKIARELEMLLLVRFSV